MAYTKLGLLGVGGTAFGGATPVLPPTPTIPGTPPTLPDDIIDAGPWERRRNLTDTSSVDGLERNIFTITYDGTTIELPIPIIGDTQNLQTTVINRRTRGGKKRVYHDPQWYAIHSYDYTFKKVNEERKDAFLSLVADAMGDQVTVIDHLDQVFIDMFIVAVGPVLEEHDDGCSYILSITLQVVR